MRINPAKPRDAEIEAREQSALLKLRKEYRMKDSGAGKFDALCPAHDDRNRSLRIWREPDGRLYFRCYAGCSFNDVRRALDLPTVNGDRNGHHASYVPKRREPRAGDLTSAQVAAMAEAFRCTAAALAPLAAELGVSVASLVDSGVGLTRGARMWVEGRYGRYEKEMDAWTWPMADGGGNATGLRLRARDTGDKITWTGTRPGLFIGRRWTGEGPLLICEGPTDRAAAFDWGYDAIGKPSCNDGDDHVCDVVRALADAARAKRKPVRPVVILSNLDTAKPIVRDGRQVGVFYPGQDGAIALAKLLVKIVPDVRIITPPTGIKDGRAWLAAGATRRDVDRAIDAKRPFRNFRWKE